MFQKTAKYLLTLLTALAVCLSPGVASVSAEDFPDVETSQQEISFPEPSYQESQEESYQESQQKSQQESQQEPQQQSEYEEQSFPEESYTPAAPVDDGGNDGNASYDDSDYDSGSSYQTAQDPYKNNDVSAKAAKSINSVKMDKSVSEKSYSTDYTAGVVSWICVGVGVIVIIVMLVSTKITGSRASRRGL